MAESLINNRIHSDFAKENKKMNGSSREMPPHMDETTETEGIAQHLSDKYSTTLSHLKWTNWTLLKKGSNMFCVDIMEVEEMEKAISKLCWEM